MSSWSKYTTVCRNQYSEMRGQEEKETNRKLQCSVKPYQRNVALWVYPAVKFWLQYFGWMALISFPSICASPTSGSASTRWLFKFSPGLRLYASARSLVFTTIVWVLWSKITSRWVCLFWNLVTATILSSQLQMGTLWTCTQDREEEAGAHDHWTSGLQWGATCSMLVRGVDWSVTELKYLLIFRFVSLTTSPTAKFLHFFTLIPQKTTSMDSVLSFIWKCCLFVLLFALLIVMSLLGQTCRKLSLDVYNWKDWQTFHNWFRLAKTVNMDGILGNKLGCSLLGTCRS